MNDTQDSTGDSTAFGGRAEPLDSNEQLGNHDPENPMYNPEFVFEVGTTMVEDKATGTKQEMWKATVTDTFKDDVEISEAEYLAEHPAEAILGAIEQATGGEL